jgi:integrase
MGSKWFTGGVVAAPRGRIQFDFILDGVRYRPTIKRPPSEANIRRARERLAVIKRQIQLGIFSFAEEFPDYRYPARLTGVSKFQLCSEVFDLYLAHCEARLRRGDMAVATVNSYRKILDGIWRPRIGHLVFQKIRYSSLIAIADSHQWSKKTYNNSISALKRAFDFGYRDRALLENPARHLRCVRLRKSDRPKIDPFSVHDAETLIAAIHRDWGEAQGNYDEFRFFTGLRPSEEIALVLSDLDLVNGVVSVNKARVHGIDQCKTKTGEDRRVELCPRALSVLERHLRLRSRLQAAGKIEHDHVFFQDSGEPIRDLLCPAIRWRKSLRSLKLRHRRPYVARHTSVSWNLMVGKNFLWVAGQHGHSTVTMLRTYAAWVEGAAEVDVEAIKRSMCRIPTHRASRVRSAEGKVLGWRCARAHHVQNSGSRSASRNGFLQSIWLGLSRCRSRSNAITHCFQIGKIEQRDVGELAGVEGFEPPNGGIKTRCLTTWRHPNLNQRSFKPPTSQARASRSVREPRTPRILSASGSRSPRLAHARTP